MYDEWGVDAGVVFPTIGILPFPCDDPKLASAYCRAYNRWQSEFAADARGRVLPIAHVFLGDLDESIRELDRCLALGFKGVFVAPEPVNGVRPGDPHFDPFWARCAEAGIPACLHVVVRFGTGMPFEPWLMTGAGTVFGFALGSPGQIIPTVASMVLDGVFDRHPALKVLCVEAGCGWAAHLMDRLDEKYELLSFAHPVALQLRPSEYLQRNVWYVAEPDERTIDSMLDLVGEDRILWGSDFPHIDSKMDAVTVIRASVASLDPARRRAVLGANAALVFGI
jgi:predicted TIM-barrel fold metal-dependent hydrolase